MRYFTVSYLLKSGKTKRNFACKNKLLLLQNLFAQDTFVELYDIQEISKGEYVYLALNDNN